MLPESAATALLMMAEAAGGVEAAESDMEGPTVLIGETLPEEPLACGRRPRTKNDALREALRRIQTATLDALPRRAGNVVFLWDAVRGAFRAQRLSDVRLVMEVENAPGAVKKAGYEAFVTHVRYELFVGGLSVGRFGASELDAKAPLLPSANFLYDPAPGVVIQARGEGQGLARIAGWKRSCQVTSQLFGDRGGRDAGYCCTLSVFGTPDEFDVVEFVAKIAPNTCVVLGDRFPRATFKATIRGGDPAVVARSTRCVALALHAFEALQSGYLTHDEHSALALAYGAHDDAGSVKRVARDLAAVKRVVIAVKGAVFEPHRVMVARTKELFSVLKLYDALVLGAPKGVLLAPKDHAYVDAIKSTARRTTTYVPGARTAPPLLRR